MNRGWWRTNRLGLIASLVSAALLAVVTVVVPWGDAMPADPPTQKVAAGGRLAWNARTFRIGAAGVFTAAGSKVSVPKGEELVVMIVVMDAGAAATTLSHTLCDVQLVASGPHGDRAWDPEDSAQLSDVHYRLQDDSQSYCAADQAKPQHWEFGFIVPAGTYASAHLSLKLVDKPGRDYVTKLYDLSLPASPERH